jgi:hypothetical protein
MLQANESFLKTIGKLSNSNDSIDFVQFEIDSKLFGKLDLICKIILNDDDIEKDAEQKLESYIELYFQILDQDDEKENIQEDELSSQYSTLSSLLGFQVDFCYASLL